MHTAFGSKNIIGKTKNRFLIIIRVLHGQFNLQAAGVGAGTVGFWIAQGWNAAFMGGPGVYEIIPGFIAATIAIVLVSLATKAEDLGKYLVEDAEPA